MPNDSPSPERLVLVLNIDLTEEPVGGILAQEQHPDRSFSGWFELVGFLEDAVREATATPPERTAT
jgi:hypothetical protein